jgi:DNA polymerase sigma
LKELTNKVSSELINRQLSGFIDSLSIETNNLYDHKIVCFERVRYFIHSIFPTSQAQLFGSNAAGLSLPTSDVDIMLLNVPCSCRE